jgi:RimJ/RimL family protein N-acetyltransferase
MITADNVEVLVAEVNNEIVGSGYARIENSKIYLKHNKYGYLGFMYVVPEHRGNGVNKMIIGTLKDWLAARDIFELRLEVYNGNLPAIRAYEKVGFAKHMVEMRLDKPVD